MIVVFGSASLVRLSHDAAPAAASVRTGNIPNRAAAVNAQPKADRYRFMSSSESRCGRVYARRARLRRISAPLKRCPTYPKVGQCTYRRSEVNFPGPHVICGGETDSGYEKDHHGRRMWARHLRSREPVLVHLSCGSRQHPHVEREGSRCVPRSASGLVDDVADGSARSRHVLRVVPYRLAVRARPPRAAPDARRERTLGYRDQAGGERHQAREDVEGRRAVLPRSAERPAQDQRVARNRSDSQRASSSPAATRRRTR